MIKMTIHREGYTILLITVIVLIVFNFLLYVLSANDVIMYVSAIISLIIFLVILQFFRNPIFDIQSKIGNILSPADGKIVVIEETIEQEYFKDKRLQVSVFMSPFNVHVNRAPVAGEINYVQYHKGKYLVAWHPKSSTENERNTVVIKTEKNEILFRQIAGALAKRIVCYVKKGDKIPIGGEFGFIKFGSRVDIFLPIGTKVNVKIGDIVKGGKTVIAEN